MSNDFDGKIVDFSRKAQNETDTQKRFFKGFQYVKITKDENNNVFKEEAILEFAKKCFYIVTVLKNNGIGAALYKYKVPYESLLKFLDEFRVNNSYGKVIDIERYVPEDLA